MEREAMLRSYPERVREALAEWAEDRTEGPQRPRRSQRSMRMQGAAGRLRRRGLGYLLAGGSR